MSKVTHSLPPSLAVSTLTAAHIPFLNYLRRPPHLVWTIGDPTLLWYTCIPPPPQAPPRHSAAASPDTVSNITTLRKSPAARACACTALCNVHLVIHLALYYIDQLGTLQNHSRR
mmetsp:Transcript_12654/g.21045  ORF Transcript_12654/g.21045 Transcript_12654/m.21045 type:complete len:115 (+) Transcript_12654:256-600(+)